MKQRRPHKPNTPPPTPAVDPQPAMQDARLNFTQPPAPYLQNERITLVRRQAAAQKIGRIAGNHYLRQVLHPSPPRIQRETAQEVKDRYTDLGGLNLQEENLAHYLTTLLNNGSYALVLAVFNLVEGYNQDDVAREMVPSITNQKLIQIARDPTGASVLRLMRNALGDWWGYITEEEGKQADLLAAVLNEGGARAIWNREQIGRLKGQAATDLEALALIFESDLIIDDGSIDSRLQAVLGATEHLVIPGLQTGIEFSDTGFAGDQNPGGAGFRDPHPSSRNQVGHFLTAVGMQFSPGIVSKPIPMFGTVRSMIQAPSGMSDADVALRLTIGHEKAPDPNGTMAAISIVLEGLGEAITPGPEGETDDERDERIGRAVEAETRRQIQAIIQAFRTQFQACTDADVQAWNEALQAMGTGDQLNMGAAEAPLSRIRINPAGRGNSIQDMRLSLVGWRLGQMIQSGSFANKAAVASWIRTNLGAH